MRPLLVVIGILILSFIMMVMAAFNGKLENSSFETSKTEILRSRINWDEIFYMKDLRTGLCYSYIGYGRERRVLLVECTDSVLKAAQDDMR